MAKITPDQITPASADANVTKIIKQMQDQIDEMQRKMEEQEERMKEREKILQDKESDLREEENVFRKDVTVENTIRERYMDKKERTRQHLEKQPKVSVYIPLEGSEKPGQMYPVTINGYTLQIPKGVYVEVPMQVLEIIKASQQQTDDAGRPFRLDLKGSEFKEAGLV